jgi:hypothetical protein
MATVWSAAVRSSTIAGTRAVPTATGTIRTTSTGIRVFGWLSPTSFSAFATVQIALKTLFFIADFADGTDYADVFCKQIVTIQAVIARAFFARSNLVLNRKNHALGDCFTRKKRSFAVTSLFRVDG